MKIRKCFIMLGIIIVSLFLTNINVYAKNELFSCKYTVDSLTSIIPSATVKNLTFTYRVYDDGTIQSASFGDFNGTDKFGGYYLTGLATFNKKFYENATSGSNHCPKIKFYTNGNSQIIITYTSYDTPDGTAEKIISGSITKVSAEEVVDNEEVICQRNSELRVGTVSSEEITITFYKLGNSKKFRVESNKGQSAEGLATESITVNGKTYTLGTGYETYYESKDKCEGASLYLDASNGDTSVKITTEDPGAENNGAKTGEDAENDDGHNDNDDDDKDYQESKDATGTCPLGKDVTNDLIEIWKIVRIVVPLLALGLTIFDFVKAVTKGEVVDESKKLKTRIVKRLLLVIALLFLVAILNSVLPLILGTKYCDLSNPTSNDVEGEEEKVSSDDTSDGDNDDDNTADDDNDDNDNDDDDGDSGSSKEEYACYQCNGEASIYKWKTNSGSDSDCSSGYHTTSSANESKCGTKPITSGTVVFSGSFDVELENMGLKYNVSSSPTGQSGTIECIIVIMDGKGNVQKTKYVTLNQNSCGFTKSGSCRQVNNTTGTCTFEIKVK